MVLRVTTKYTYGDGTPRKFYGCIRYPHCNGSHGAHPNGLPLGVPADDALKSLRFVKNILKKTKKVIDNLLP